MIPADILTVLFAVAILALVYLAGRKVWRGITKDREPETYMGTSDLPPANYTPGKWAAKMLPTWCFGSEPVEPETYGDDGGWPTYGLKRLDGHKRGRVEVTGKGGRK